MSLLICLLSKIPGAVLSPINLVAMFQWWPELDKARLVLCELLEFLSGQILWCLQACGYYRCFDNVDHFIAEMTAVRPDRVGQLTLPPDWSKQGLCQVVREGQEPKKDHVYVMHRFLNVVKPVNVAKFGAQPFTVQHNFSEARVCLRPTQASKTLPILLAPVFEAESEKAYGGWTALAKEDGSVNSADSRSSVSPEINSTFHASSSQEALPRSQLWHFVEGGVSSSGRYKEAHYEWKCRHSNQDASAG